MITVLAGYNTGDVIACLWEEYYWDLLYTAFSGAIIDMLAITANTSSM